MLRSKISCNRCGTCCRKGGPGLHKEDVRLIEQGVLSSRDIVCFRRGEFAYDQVNGRLQPLEQELLKIRGKAGSWECTFYDPDSNGCRIYHSRPLECRKLMCWDTAPLEKVLAKDDRLQREHLVPVDSALALLINDHEKRCGLDLVAGLVKDYQEGNNTARKKVIDICCYDLSFREAIQEKTGNSGLELECYFGRPLFQAIRGYDMWFASESFLKYFE